MSTASIVADVVGTSACNQHRRAVLRLASYASAMRLDEFLTENRAQLIERCRLKVSSRHSPRPTAVEIERGIPLFMDQLIRALRLRLVATNPERTDSATIHGADLMQQGFTVGQLVHDYGDVCQSVTELAIELEAPIANEDFRILNRCLDDAIADAVSEFSRLREIGLAAEGNERLGFLAHEVRNLLTTACLTFEVLKSGNVGVTGSTGAVLERTLRRLAALVDRAVTDVRLEAGHIHREHLDVRRLLEELEISATLSARPKGVSIAVELPREIGVAVEGDPQILAAILVNLVQNAVKFTNAEGQVTVTTRVTAGRVEIDVADQCGGLPPGFAEEVFRTFDHRGQDRTGLGLGLVIARRGAEAHDGEIRVRDVPGVGCVFTLSLPRAL
jgi:signal transduction histidine kinase